MLQYIGRLKAIKVLFICLFVLVVVVVVVILDTSRVLSIPNLIYTINIGVFQRWIKIFLLIIDTVYAD